MDSKVQSILSYLGILWLLAYFLGKEQRDEVSRFHLKQGLGLIIVSFVGSFILGILAFIVPSLAIISNIYGLLMLILIIIGIVNAVNQKMKPLPVIGDMFKGSFSFIDKN